MKLNKKQSEKDTMHIEANVFSQIQQIKITKNDLRMTKQLSSKTQSENEDMYD